MCRAGCRGLAPVVSPHGLRKHGGRSRNLECELGGQIPQGRHLSMRQGTTVHAQRGAAGNQVETGRRRHQMFKRKTGLDGGPEGQLLWQTPECQKSSTASDAVSGAPETIRTSDPCLRRESWRPRSYRVFLCNQCVIVTDRDNHRHQKTRFSSPWTRKMARNLTHVK